MAKSCTPPTARLATATEREREALPGAPPHNQDGHTWHHPDAQLEEWILHGKPPGAMPAFEDQLNREDVQAVLAFIKTWWTAEQREMQADVSRRYQEGLDRQKQGR